MGRWVHSQSYGQSYPSSDSLQLEKNLFENALLQIEAMLVKDPPADSLIYDLLSDANEFAESNQWKEGRVILQSLLSLISENNPNIPSLPENGENSSQGTANPYNLQATTSSFFTSQFRIETGVDYSQQEFEMTFLETDSVLIDELQNPYVSVYYSRPFQFGNQAMLMNHMLRIDNQFINYGIFTTLESRLTPTVSRLELDANYFLTQTSQDASFFDGKLSYLVGRPYHFPHRWYIDANTRFKWYPSPDSFSANILSANIGFNYEYLFGIGHSFLVTLMPAFYKEARASQYQYFQTQLSGEYQYRDAFNRYVRMKTEFLYNDFTNLIGDSTYQNQYRNIKPQVRAEWAFSRRVGISVTAGMEKRMFSHVNAISPNFTLIEVEAIPKLYWGELNSVGMGLFWEKQVQQANTPDDEDFVKQGEYTARGIIFSTEYLQLEGVFVNFEYRVSWRDYPFAQDTYLNSFYSNRFIHSLSLFGWIPITRHWQIQLFANYDNDQDRDIQNNDNRNTIVSAGIIYKF